MNHLINLLTVVCLLAPAQDYDLPNFDQTPPELPTLDVDAICGQDTPAPFGFRWALDEECVDAAKEGFAARWEGAMFAFLAQREGLIAEMGKARQLTDKRRLAFEADPTPSNRHLYALALGAEEGIRMSAWSLVDAVDRCGQRLVQNYLAMVAGCCQLEEI